MRITVVALLVALAAGCAPSGPSAFALALRDRAVFDLRCTSLAWTRIDRRTYGVSGCGQRAVYQTACHDGRWGPSDCTWTRDGEVASDGARTD